MDGHFVPNLTIGPPVLKSLRKVTKLPIDCHLMIEIPINIFPISRTPGPTGFLSIKRHAAIWIGPLHLIKNHHCRAGVVINPATPVEALTEVLDVADYVLVMSVNPGFGGQNLSLEFTT